MLSLLKRAWATPAIRALLVLAIFTSIAQACPNCGTAVGENDSANGGSVGAGYQYSIYFMIAVPYAILFSAGYWLYRSFSRAMAEQEAAHLARASLPAGAETALTA